MTEERVLRKLELVRKPARRVPWEFELSGMEAQQTLFPVRERNLLVFAIFPDITEEEFMEALRQLKPTYILELRRSPRFDLGRMNRKAAFREFEESRSKYIDLPARVDWLESTVDQVELVRQFLKSCRDRIQGPVMVLITCRGESDELTDSITKLFSLISDSRWDTYVVPYFE